MALKTLNINNNSIVSPPGGHLRRASRPCQPSILQQQPHRIASDVDLFDGLTDPDRPSISATTGMASPPEPTYFDETYRPDSPSISATTALHRPT